MFEGQRAEVDAFLSPRWGGLMIYNVAGPTENATLPDPVLLDMKRVMETFLSQLRLLIGINKQVENLFRLTNNSVELSV